MSWIGRFLAHFGDAQVADRPAPGGDAQRVAQVQAILAQLAPLLAADGGRIELLGTRDGIVSVELRGACTNCGASDLTTEGVLEPRLRAELPWFEELRVESAEAFARRERRLS
jgi:Fe-S cluster biogenesis protein NfuA